MTGASARVAVDLVDELGDGAHAVSNHMGRVPPDRSNHAVADHQQSKIMAGNEALDHDVFMELRRRGIGDSRCSRLSMLTVTPLA